MKRGILHTSEKSSRMIAMLLLICFAYASFFPLLHSHACIGHYEQSSEEDAGTLTAVCKICDHFVHQQGKEFQLSYPPTITPILPAPIEHDGPVCAGIYEMTLNAFTNKGPPVLA